MMSSVQRSFSPAVWSLLLTCVMSWAGPAYPTASIATSSVATFGDEGELFEVLEGSYGSLFPGGYDAASESPVLAIRHTPAAGQSQLFLVPNTDGPELDRDPVIVHETGQLFLLWSSGLDAAPSELNLVAFDGQDFGEVIEVSGNPSKLKGKPRFAVTRDPYGDGALAPTRTIVHLLWWEDAADSVAVLYTPVVLVEGEYLGWNPVVTLDSFDLNADDPALESRLFRAASIERGTDGRTVVIGLPQQRTSRLLTLRMRVLPWTLVKVADDARSQIVGIGRSGAGSILKVADAARSQIVGIGRMHQGVLDYVADEVYFKMLSYGASYDESDVEALGALGWQTTLLAGASILGNGLRNAELPCSTLFLGDEPTQQIGTSHQIEVCLASDRALPSTPPDLEHTVFVSETGENVLVAWTGAEGATVHYQESLAEDWSQEATVSTGSELSIEKALQLLSQQVRYQ